MDYFTMIILCCCLALFHHRILLEVFRIISLALASTTTLTRSILRKESCQVPINYTWVERDICGNFDTIPCLGAYAPGRFEPLTL